MTHTWEALVANVRTKIIPCWNDRPGRMCKLKPQKSREAGGSIRENCLNARCLCAEPSTSRGEEHHGKTSGLVQINL